MKCGKKVTVKFWWGGTQEGNACPEHVQEMINLCQHMRWPFRFVTDIESKKLCECEVGERENGGSE